MGRSDRGVDGRLQRQLDELRVAAAGAGAEIIDDATPTLEEVFVARAAVGR